MPFQRPHRFLIVTAILLLAAAGAGRPARANPINLLLLQSGAGGGSSEVERLIGEGASALERGEAERAKSLFKRVLEIEPANPAAHTYLGVIADQEGNLTEAERHFSAAAIADPVSPAARNNYGAILLKLGRTDQAIKQFETSLRLDKNQPNALVNLAQIYFARGTPESLRAALDLFQRARALKPDAEISRALVITSLRLKDKQAAATNYRDYTSSLNDSSAKIDSASRATLGAALLEAGLLDEAVAELNSAVEAEPNNTGAIINLARAYQTRGEIPAAGRTLERAVARGIESGPIYAALADIYEASGHLENAIPAMRLAIEKEPQNEFYRFRYGMLLTDTKAPAAAVIRLQESLSEFPRSSRLWFALGVADANLDKYDEAAQAFKRAIELDEKFAPALAYLGMTYDQQGQYKEAAALYERALAVDERMAAVHYLLGDLMLKLPDADLKSADAESHLSRAVKLDEQFVPAHMSLGKLYVRLNRLGEAAAQFESAVKLQPDLADAYYQLGRVYARLHRKAEAEDSLATFKRLSETQREQSRNQQKEIARRLANVRF